MSRNKHWCNAIYKKDNYTCQKCGSKKHIEAHHIENYLDNPEMREKLTNGVVLCNKCHSEFHSKYRKINNTGDQLLEFLGKKSWKHNRTIEYNTFIKVCEKSGKLKKEISAIKDLPTKSASLFSAYYFLSKEKDMSIEDLIKHHKVLTTITDLLKSKILMQFIEKE